MFYIINLRLYICNNQLSIYFYSFLFLSGAMIVLQVLSDVDFIFILVIYLCLSSLLKRKKEFQNLTFRLVLVQHLIQLHLEESYYVNIFKTFQNNLEQKYLQFLPVLFKHYILLWSLISIYCVKLSCMHLSISY